MSSRRKKLYPSAIAKHIVPGNSGDIIDMLYYMAQPRNKHKYINTKFQHVRQLVIGEMRYLYNILWLSVLVARSVLDVTRTLLSSLSTSLSLYLLSLSLYLSISSLSSPLLFSPLLFSSLLSSPLLSSPLLSSPLMFSPLIH